MSGKEASDCRDRWTRKTAPARRDVVDFRTAGGSHLSALGPSACLHSAGCAGGVAVCCRDCCVSLFAGFRGRGNAGTMIPSRSGMHHFLQGESVAYSAGIVGGFRFLETPNGRSDAEIWKE